MKMCSLALAAATMALGAPALAQQPAVQHSATIDHAVGTIAADYSGTSRVSLQQIGSIGGAGRQDTLRCRWTVSLVVERHARLGAGQEARRTLAQADVVKGSSPGWCPQRDQAATRLAAKHRADLHAALMALVERDKAMILADADRMRDAPREG